MRRAVLLAILLGLGAGPGGCHRQVRTAAKAPEADGGQKKFSALTAKAKVRKGFFDTYQKGDELYLAVPKKRLGEEFLLYTRVARGIGMNGLISGMWADGMEAAVVSLERHGDRIYLVHHVSRVTAPAGSPLERAIRQSYSSSVLQSATVESERPDGAALVNIKGWVTGNLSPVGRLAGMLTRQRSEHGVTLEPKADRSFIDSVKAFPENLDVRAMLTFAPPDPLVSSVLPDERFPSILVHYSFARLPEQPMTPRPYDDRVGFFALGHLDLASARPDFLVRSIHRWRLEAAAGQGGRRGGGAAAADYVLHRSVGA